MVILMAVLGVASLAPIAIRGQEVRSLQDTLKAAAKAEHASHYEQAANLYARALSSPELARLAPSVAINARTRLATDLFLLHRYQDSLNALAPWGSKGSSEIPWPAQAWLVDGLDRLELGQVPEAEASLRKTLALNPDSGTARLALGDDLARAGRMEEAAQQYEEQTQRTPTQPDAWYKLGLAYAQLSTRVAQGFAQKRPDDTVGRRLMAEGLLDQGDDQGAARALFRLVRENPDQPQANADLGAALGELGYPKAAEERFRLELAGDADCPDALVGLAETATLAGNWTEVTSALERLLGSNPEEFARRLELPPLGILRDAWRRGAVRPPPSFAASPVGSLWQTWLGGSGPPPSLPGPPADGTALTCSDLRDKAAVTPGIWLTRACYGNLRERLTVRKAKKTLLSQERSKLAETEYRLGDYQAARREAEGILAADPGSGWAVYWLSMSYGTFAEECFAKVAALSPDSARVHEMLAHYWAGRHYYPRAKAEYLAAIKLAPELPDLHIGLATVYMTSSEWTEAESELKRTLELSPGSALASYELGDAYVELGRWEQAIDPLRKAAQDPSYNVKARVDLAKAESETGRISQAIQDLLPILQADQDGQIYYRLADLYRKLGDKEKMKEALTTFRRLQSSSLEVDQQQLDELDREREASDSGRTAHP